MLHEAKVVGIIQARMGSSRLPGKVLLPLAGKPVLTHVIERLERCETIDELVVATSSEVKDDPIVSLCEAAGVSAYRGSEHDVLERYWEAATAHKADWVVRITADCPAIDSGIVDEVVRRAVREHWDCFGLGGSFPNGLDCTVYSYAALSHANDAATLNSDREHVGPFIIRNYGAGSYEPFSALGHLRFTLDEPADYEVLKRIFESLGAAGNYFSGADIVAFLSNHAEITALNSHIIRNEGYLTSVAQDKRSLENH